MYRAGLYEDAVHAALPVDLDLAKQIAGRPEDLDLGQLSMSMGAAAATATALGGGGAGSSSRLLLLPGVGMELDDARRRRLWLEVRIVCVLVEVCMNVCVLLIGGE